MADVAELGIVVELKDGQLVARTLDNIGDAAERTEKRAESLMAGWKRMASVIGLGFLAREELQNIIDAQNAMAQLTAATEAMGGASGRTVNELDDLSLALQNMTAFNDEAIKHSEALLLTFDKIRGVNFDRATVAVVNLAARLGGDLQGAALQVGKALQDPELGMNALRRAGVSFTDSQKELIKNFTATGEVAKAQEIILRALERQFGGSAEAARDTLGGALTALKNHIWDNLELTKQSTAGLITFINTLDKAVQSLGNYRAEIQTLVLVLGGAGLVGVLTKLIPVVQASAVVIGTKLGIELLGVRAAFAVAAAGGSGLNGVLLGLSATVTGMAAALAVVVAPLALLYREWVKSEQILDDANEHLNKVLDDQWAKMHARNLQRTKAAQDAKDEAEAVVKLVADRQLEIDKQTALNAAYGRTDDVLKIIEIRYNALAQKRKDAATHHGKELEALNKSTDALAAQQIKAVQLEAATKKLNDEWQRAHDLNENRAKALNSVLDFMTKRADESYKRIKEGNDAVLEDDRRLSQERINNERAADEAIWEARRQKQEAGRREYEEVFSNMIENIQRKFGDMFTAVFGKGKSIFQQLAGEVAAMFASQKIKQAMSAVFMAGGGSGSFSQQIIRDTIVKPGIAGIAGFGTGYGVGSMTTHQGLGALGGAASGAAMGFMIAGPAGAAVGALAGLAGGIIGSGKAAKEAAEQERQLQQAYAVNVAQIKLTLGIFTPLQAALANSKKQFQELTDNIQKAYAGKAHEEERNKLLLEAQDLERRRNEQLRQEAEFQSKVFDENLRVRALRAQNQSEEADALALAIQQETEYNEAKKNGATTAQLAALKTIQLMETQQKQADLEEAHKRALEDLNLRMEAALGTSQDVLDDMRFRIDQEREYKDAVRAGRDAVYLATLAQTQHAEAVARAITKVQATIAGLTSTINGLQDFQNKLKLDATQSAASREAEALRQYNATLGLAKGGNQDAANRLPQVAQQYLDILREIYASGPNFAAGFARVQQDTADVIAVFQAQKTAAEKQLETLQKILDEIRVQNDMMRLPPPDTLPRKKFPGLGSGSANFTPADIEGTSESTAVLREGFNQLIGKVDAVSRKLDEQTTIQRSGFDSLSLRIE